MSLTLTSPVTGTAQTGFTSPTYTLVSDVAPDNSNGKQWAVTALGGTQTDVAVHTANKPFTVTLVRPKVMKLLGFPNPATGVLPFVPKNTWKIIVRKGLRTSDYVGPNAVAMATLNVDVPAGDATQEVEELRAMLSLMGGSITQLSAALGDSIISGIF